jgi:surfeit locus 1 family protein
MTAGAHAWTVAVAALLAALLTARLGVWQLDRAGQKEALQAAIDTQAALPILKAAELPRRALPTGRAPTYRRIELEGQWLADRTVYLDNRQMGGHPGWFVMTPLRLPEGDAVLVQRGWLPRGPQDRKQVPPFETSVGSVRLLARIAPPPSRLMQLGADSPGPIRQNLDLDAFADEIDTPLRPLTLVELATAANAGDGLRRDWPQPALDVQKHYGYAAQWFAFCALTTGLYVWFQLLRPRRRASA